MVGISRRSFLKYCMASGALVISTNIFSLNSKVNADEWDYLKSTLITISPDNTITFYSPAPDMGQGTDTALAMLFLEELDADFMKMTTKPLSAGNRFNQDSNKVWQVLPQWSGGSDLVTRNWDMLRQAGAMTRQLFLQAAAKKLELGISELSTHKSFVKTKSGLSIPYSDLIYLAAKETISQDYTPSLKESEDWKIIGKPHVHKVTDEIITGVPLYGIDQEYEGAYVAVIARCPFFDGVVNSVDSSETLKVKGVHKVIELDRPDLSRYYTYLAAGVVVIADSFWAAKKGRDALKIEWGEGPNKNESSEKLHAKCDELLKTEGQIIRDDGNVQAAFKNAAKVIKRQYNIPLVSHAQLEPQVCIADVVADHVTLICPTQNPGGSAAMAAKVAGVDRSNVNMSFVRSGGSFGRRTASDHVAEAVTISKKTGLPIKLIWTREDDMAHDFYRPMGHHELSAAIDNTGKVVGWKHRLAGTSKFYRRDGLPDDKLYVADFYIDDFPSGIIENLQYEYHPIETNIPMGSWRAPAHTANSFVIQSFLDEIAHELDADPLDFRLGVIGDEDMEIPYRNHGMKVFKTARLKNVLRRVAKNSGWGKTLPKGHKQGISCHCTFGGYCAYVVEIKTQNNRNFKIHKVYSAVDIGVVVNPNGVRSLLEGAVNDGISTAIDQEVLIEGGSVVSTNFDSYQMMRIDGAPTEIDIEIIDSDEPPSGMGEIGIPPIAPALTNAIAAHGGERIRHHPINKNIKAKQGSDR